MPNSIHTVRWIQQLDSAEFDLHFFPSDAGKPSTELSNIDLTLHFAGPISRAIIATVRRLKWRKLDHKIKPLGNLLERFDRSYWLGKTIQMTRPDIVHSLEFQKAGYRTSEARRHAGNSFPTWIVSNWGSDIYLFARLAAHRSRIMSILENVDYYWCECARDVELAQRLGLNGEVGPVVPNSGGIELQKVEGLRSEILTSHRSTIIVKGYQGWAGRALCALRALALSVEEIADYQIVVYSASPDVKIAAELLAYETGLTVDLLPKQSHDQMLKHFSRARIYVGLSISDAISTSLLEAMVTGAFPIQSGTSCANEWIEDRKSGLIVSPEDPQAVAEAIRLAARNDDMVNQAAEINWHTAEQRLDTSVVEPIVVEHYRRIAASATIAKNQG
jgi:glycosyltransferase involved in cell wall biosynthesis